MAASKQPVSKWSDGSVPLEELAEAHQIAHQIVTDRGDLASSVNRIMDAELSEDGQLQAIASFSDALTDPGDPNRDPRVCIAAAAKV